MHTITHDKGPYTTLTKNQFVPVVFLADHSAVPYQSSDPQAVATYRMQECQINDMLSAEAVFVDITVKCLTDWLYLPVGRGQETYIPVVSIYLPV